MGFTFRYHRECLDDSLKTSIQVNDFADLHSKIQENFMGRVGNIECKYYCFDERINWHTWIITMDGDAIGFSNGDISKGN